MANDRRKLTLEPNITFLPLSQISLPIKESLQSRPHKGKQGINSRVIIRISGLCAAWPFPHDSYHAINASVRPSTHIHTYNTTHHMNRSSSDAESPSKPEIFFAGVYIVKHLLVLIGDAGPCFTLIPIDIPELYRLRNAMMLCDPNCERKTIFQTLCAAGWLQRKRRKFYCNSNKKIVE